MKPNSKGSNFATNKGGIIKAPKSGGSDGPKSTIVKGNDLRNGSGNSKK